MLRCRHPAWQQQAENRKGESESLRHSLSKPWNHHRLSLSLSLSLKVFISRLSLLCLPFPEFREDKVPAALFDLPRSNPYLESASVRKNKLNSGELCNQTPFVSPISGGRLPVEPLPSEVFASLTEDQLEPRV